MRWFNFKISSKKKYFYKIVDSNYCSNIKLCELDFLMQDQHKSLQVRPVSVHHNFDQKNTFNDKALIGEKEYSLIVKSMSDSSYFLQCDDEQYTLNKNCVEATTTSDIDMTVLLGPVLILNLAINSVFCLHASAFILNNKIFILMADSGTGKSTIARFIDKQANCQRIADDILPLKFNNNRLTILPNFPQLKLNQEQQYKGESLQLETVLLFAEKSKQETRFKLIDTFTSIKKLIKHSVATKIFASNELKNHLAFCHNVSSQAKSYHVKYQHSDNSLQQLLDALNEIS
jgi:hypothetical protein